jgi:hypothetical protein
MGMKAEMAASAEFVEKLSLVPSVTNCWCRGLVETDNETDTQKADTL